MGSSRNGGTPRGFVAEHPREGQRRPCESVESSETSKPLWIERLCPAVLVLPQGFVAQAAECVDRPGEKLLPPTLTAQFCEEPLGERALLVLRQFGGLGKRLL